ncbi:ABC transporter permease (plasmid) [Pukyongiella litopenaei]|uniref:ABC transporter permease n=2 Tax=Pukyongiella litopenaei TaxID=2605946 RepID=A0A5C2H6S7_9RHOB|nr:ABC transporter permease [Pukyongiella litopenaei]
MFAFATVVLTALIVTALLAPWLTQGSVEAQSLSARLKPPGWVDASGHMYLAGTDHLGRDVLARLIYGSRLSLAVGTLAVAFGGAVGLVLGLISGYYGGKVDAVIMRFTDMQLAFPFMLLALALVTILGPSVINVILVLAITSWIVYAKVVRGDVLQLRNREFIEAARVLGIPDRRIIFRHILPNIFSSFLVVASFQVAALIIAESSLSFLGLGVPSNIPTWGTMLADGREYVRDAWWLSVFPGVAIMLAALSFNLLGDGLRDLLDPTMRASSPTRKRRIRFFSPRNGPPATPDPHTAVKEIGPLGNESNSLEIKNVDQSRKC